MLVFLIHFRSDIHAVTMLDYALGMCGFVIISDCQQQILHYNKGGRYNLLDFCSGSITLLQKHFTFDQFSHYGQYSRTYPERKKY